MSGPRLYTVEEVTHQAYDIFLELAPNNLSEKDVLDLDIPKKTAAKLISKITGENTKACYQRLLDIE